MAHLARDPARAAGKWKKDHGHGTTCDDDDTAVDRRAPSGFRRPARGEPRRRDLAAPTRYPPSPMNRYPFAEVEPRWQKHWEEHQTFRVEDPAGRSFAQAQVLHASTCFPIRPDPVSTSATSKAIPPPTSCRATRRMRGFNVLHPMGWDAFGLPAEQYAVKTGIHPAITTAENVATFRRQMKRAGLSLRLVARDQHHRPRLLPLDAVDLPPAVRARAGLRRRGAGQLVPGARHRARERRGDRRQERGRRLRRRAAADAPVGAQDHRVRRPPARGPEARRLAAQHARDAAQLDRTLDRRRRRVPARRRHGQHPHLHHAAGHAVRRHLHGAGARASAGRGGGHARAPRRGRGLSRGRVAQERPPAHRAQRRRRPASSPAATRSIRSTARSYRSGSPTTC